jgi:hypothetical protein
MAITKNSTSGSAQPHIHVRAPTTRTDAASNVKIDDRDDT